MPEPKGLSSVRWSALGLVLAAFGLIGVAVIETDALVENTFATALHQSDRAETRIAAPAPPIPGTEDYWLRSAPANPAIKPAAAAVPSRGDRFAITTAGVERIFEVVAVSETETAVVPVGSGGRSLRQLEITLKAIDDADDDPVRIVLDAGGRWPALFAVKSVRTL